MVAYCMTKEFGKKKKMFSASVLWWRRYRKLLWIQNRIIKMLCHTEMTITETRSPAVDTKYIVKQIGLCDYSIEKQRKMA